MAKDLRTKINELPICEDMELIDTLIAIGTDGKTYRVNKDNVGGKVDDWVFLNYSIGGDEREANSMSIRIDCTQFDELFNIGGKIHVYLHRMDEVEVDVELVELSFIMGSNISEGIVFCVDYQYPFNVLSTIFNNEIMALSLTHTPGDSYDVCEIVTVNSNHDVTTTINDFQLDGIYFEPLPFLNVTREEGGVNPPQ